MIMQQLFKDRLLGYGSYELVMILFQKCQLCLFAC